MPIRMLLERFQENHSELNEIPTGRQAAGGSESQAHSSALTNAVNVAGIPITNTVSGGHASSTGTGHAGNFQEQFNLGGYGLNVGLASDKVGTGIGINREPGQAGFHIGGFNLGFVNNGGLLGGNKNTQTESGATASAVGQGVQSSSQSNTQSNSHSHLGGLVNVQNTLSNSQAQAYAQNGATTANTGASSVSAQSTNVPITVQSPGQQQAHQLGPGISSLFSSFPVNPFNHFHQPTYGIQNTPAQSFPGQFPTQQQFPNQPYGHQQFPNQFLNSQFPNQYYPGQQYPYQPHHHHQQYPYQPFPNQHGYNGFPQQSYNPFYNQQGQGKQSDFFS